MAGLVINIFVGIGVTWAAAFLALIGRFIARRMTKQSWSYEDYFCISALFFGSIYSSILIEWTVDWSLGQYIPGSTSVADKEKILEYSRKLAFFASLSYAFSISSSKLTILSFYWRIFQHTAIRIPIIVMMVLVVAWIILRTFMVIFRCSPVPAYWDKTIPGGSCSIADSSFFFGTVFPHFVMDIVILILPVIPVFNLQLPVGQKIAVVGLFAIGTIVCVASIFVLVESIHSNPSSDQVPHDYALNYLWGAVELNMAVVSACFPLLRPLFRYVFGNRILNGYGETNITSRRLSFVIPGHELPGLRAPRLPRRTLYTNETSSTRQLADEESAASEITDMEPSSVKGPEPVHTTITSQHNGPSPWNPGELERGILVQNDVTIQVKHARPAV
ncbi:unnamed protein product [Clonostachys byssicola]|uniref:Rhodopsin domain-containing protein n=1 Tax=Clonostachys byssicola TaxID=160290 RepID=A0A9N9UHI7_9HYPO|nr:unnamed protein product [Clonostachys byssicola]